LANVQVERFAQGHIERTNPSADGCGQRPLDPDQKFLERFHRFIRQPGIEQFESLLARVDFHPVDLTLAAVGFLHRRIEHAHRSPPDVASRPVALDERDDGMVGNLQFTVLDDNFRPASGDFDLLV